MKYYIDRSTGELFAYESDGSQDSLIGEGFELLDAKGLAKVRAAQAAAAAPTPGQILAAANAERDSLLVVAGLRIAPLQDAVDLGRATDVESANLTLWKQYRVDVNRVSDQVGFPEKFDWPVPPG